MRKLTMLLLAAVLAIPMGVAAADPGAVVAAHQAAQADWLVWHDNDLSWYFAGAMRGTDESGVFSIAYAGKGDCDVSRDRHGTTVVCMAHGRGKSVGLDQFEFDPTMSSARLSFKQGGLKHNVVWQSTDTVPFAQAAVAGGDGFAGTQASLSRSAVAWGKVMGRNIPKRSRSVDGFAGLGQGALALVFTDYGRTVRIDDNGIVHIRSTFRLER